MTAVAMERDRWVRYMWKVKFLRFDVFHMESERDGNQKYYLGF